MRDIIKFETSEIEPDRIAVLKNQGITKPARLPEKIHQLLDRALDILATISEPRGIISDISAAECETVYRGEGSNEPDTPLEGIIKRADYLALFAVTIGEEVSTKISELFYSNEFALGYMLDSVASEAADNTAIATERYLLDGLKKQGLSSPSTAVLGYSPGYCGWHISSQKKLFEYLRPEEIGITLRESYLMQPLKSVSGVLVAGDKEIHVFDNNYPFCDQCEALVCRHRIQSVHGS